MTSTIFCVIIQEISKYTHGYTTLQIVPLFLVFLYIVLDKSYIGVFYIPAKVVLKSMSMYLPIRLYICDMVDLIAVPIL